MSLWASVVLGVVSVVVVVVVLTVRPQAPVAKSLVMTTLPTVFVETRLPAAMIKAIVMSLLRSDKMRAHKHMAASTEQAEPKRSALATVSNVAVGEQFTGLVRPRRFARLLVAHDGATVRAST